MKKLILSIVVLLTLSVCNAQKVDLDRFYVKVNFRNLPQKPLGFDYKTFSVETSFTSLISQLVTPDEVKPNFNIEGFKRVEENGDIKIRFEVRDIELSRTEVKSRVEEKKDKAGNVTSRKTLYWLEIDYSMYARCDAINNRTQEPLTKKMLEIQSKKHEFKSSETNSYNAARDLYALNKEMVLRKFVNSLFQDYYSKMNQELTYNYGYKLISGDELVWILTSKKHPETVAYTNNYNIMKDAFSLMTADAPVDQVKEKLQPVIEYLNGLITKYTSPEKPDKKMRYSAYYNLGKIYYYLEMLDEAIAQSNALITNDYDTGDGKRLIDDANELKELFKKNNMTSRHFERNFPDAL